MHRLALALVLLAAPGLAHGQAAALVVETDGAAVYVTAVGGAVRGPFAPGAVVPTAAGPVRVTAVAAAASWDGPRAEADVVLAAGDTLRVALPLPVRYRVETLPLGAAVTVEAGGAARPLGQAPATVDLPRGQAATVTARLDGYADARAALDGAGGTVSLRLRPDGAPADGAVPAVTLLPTERSRRPRTLVDVGVGALALAAGAVAVYYKFEADRLDDRYRDPSSPERGNEDLRARAERLDGRSLVALGAMQVGVGVLALRFVLR